MADFRMVDGEDVYRSQRLDAFAWLRHGFGTRQQTGWSEEPPTVTLKQIHSDRIVVAGDGEGCIGEGDALITNRPLWRLTIRTADCVPLLMVDVQRRVIAAVHAGWRGTAEQIATKTVTRMGEVYGSKPDNVWVAIGPGIGQCCYEVGADVAGRFTAWTGQAGTHVDLAEINRLQVVDAGVPGRQVGKVDLCTRCGETQFHSFRRDGEKAGRMVSGIWMVTGS